MITSQVSDGAKPMMNQETRKSVWPRTRTFLRPITSARKPLKNALMPLAVIHANTDDIQVR